MRKEDYIYLIWQEPETHRRMVVGELKREDGFSFFYTHDYKKAIEMGWEMLTPFPEEKVYRNKFLFPAFSSRLPDPKRRDIQEILSKYGMEEYDGYELLKRSGAKLPIDDYEFVDPIFPDDETVSRNFYVSGVRHATKCADEDCVRIHGVYVGDELELVLEPNNPVDQFAVALYSPRGDKIGYVPSYFSEQVTHRLKVRMTYQCKVIEVNQGKNCREGIRVNLQLPRIEEGMDAG